MAKRFHRHIGRRHRRAFRLAQFGQLGLDQFAWNRIQRHSHNHFGRRRNVENLRSGETWFDSLPPILERNGFRTDMRGAGEHRHADDRERKLHARKIPPAARKT